MKRAYGAFIAAGACFALALFFAFALIGYTFTALVFSAIGLIILLYWLLWRFEKKTLRGILTFLICIFLIGFAVIEIPIIRVSHGETDFDADYAIVLGAGVNGSTPSLSLVNRLEAALSYLEAHPDCKAILTGGQGRGEDLSEAQAMYLWLTRIGVSPERLLIEDKAVSTQENLKFSFDIIGTELGTARIAVVSSEYHLYRAQYMAHQMGVELSGIPARTTYPVLRANYFIREAFAVAYLRVFGM